MNLGSFFNSLFGEGNVFSANGADSGEAGGGICPPDACLTPARTEFLNEIVERFFLAAAPELREVDGWRDELRGAMSGAWHLAASLRAALDLSVPPPRLAPGDWRDTPLVNAFFATPEAVSVFLASCEPLGDYFGATQAERAYCLLAAERSDRLQPGSPLAGKPITDEPPKIEIVFTNQHLWAPSHSPAELLDAVEEGICMFLASGAASVVKDARAKLAHAEEGRQEAAAMLKTLRKACGTASGTMGGSFGAACAPDAETARLLEESEKARAWLAEMEKESAFLAGEVGGPAELLAYSKRAVGALFKTLTIRRASLCLTREGLLQDPGGCGPEARNPGVDEAGQVEFTEMRDLGKARALSMTEISRESWRSARGE